MNSAYWDRISKNYQSEVLSVFDNDLQGVVEEKIATAGVMYPEGRAADIGCGIGRFTPLLSDTFSAVEACDFTSVGLRKAKARCRNRANVSFHEADLTVRELPFDPVEFAFCVNVLIMPSLSKRMRAWDNVAGRVASGGTLLLVVPSYESAQMEYFYEIRTRLEDGESSGSAVDNSIGEKATTADMRMGVLQLDGVRTKHYLKEEVESMIRARGFEIGETRKVTFPPVDGSNFESWDWLVVARKPVEAIAL